MSQNVSDFQFIVQEICTVEDISINYPMVFSCSPYQFEENLPEQV